jgi:hypothetical protein
VSGDRPIFAKVKYLVIRTDNCNPVCPGVCYEQRWAKVTTLRALTIFLEALLHLEKRLGGWTAA